MSDYGWRGERFWLVRIEFIAIMLAFVVPVVPYSLLHPEVSFEVIDWRQEAWSLILNLGAIVLVLFVLWASGDEVVDFGLRWPAREDWVPLTLSLIVGSIAGFITLALMPDPDVNLLERQPAFIKPLLLVALLTSAVSIELLHRAYVILRLAEFTGGLPAAVVLSSAIQGAMVMAWGWNYVVLWAGLGLLQSLIFVRWRVLWPLVAGSFAALLIIYSETFLPRP